MKFTVENSLWVELLKEDCGGGETDRPENEAEDMAETAEGGILAGMNL